MTRERVDTMLASYREFSARAAFLEHEIPELERLVEELKANIVDDEVHITQVISDMPKGNATSDPTAKIGMMLADEIVPRRIGEIIEEIEEKRKELSSKRPTAVFVEAWLKCLNARELFLVTEKKLDQETWSNIESDYEQRFGIHKSQKSLAKRYGKAMAKIYKIAGAEE